MPTFCEDRHFHGFHGIPQLPHARRVCCLVGLASVSHHQTRIVPRPRGSSRVLELSGPGPTLACGGHSVSRQEFGHPFLVKRELRRGEARSVASRRFAF
jgi:hypothetical protein